MTLKSTFQEKKETYPEKKKRLHQKFKNFFKNKALPLKNIVRIYTSNKEIWEIPNLNSRAAYFTSHWWYSSRMAPILMVVQTHTLSN